MGRTNMDGRRWLLFLTTSSDDTKPSMILVALIKGFQNHIGFAIIRASGEEWQARVCGMRACIVYYTVRWKRLNRLAGSDSV